LTGFQPWNRSLSGEERIMKSFFTAAALAALLAFTACTKQESQESPKKAEEAPAAVPSAGGPQAVVVLKDGSKVPGTIVASSATEMTVAGRDGKEQTLPISDVKSVEYVAPAPEAAPQTAAREGSAREQSPRPSAEPSRVAPAPAQRAVTTRTYELPAGSEVSVRTNETIDSATADEGQAFDVVVTRDAKDEDAAVVIPRGAEGKVVIKSASKGGRFKGTSDLLLDLQTVTINGKRYSIDAVDIQKKGKSGVGANKRTATYSGGGAALGAIIGAIAGGGKGAAIGAGAGAGAGVLTQVITKGGSIRVPVETVLTFRLDKPLKVTVAQ
jgi:hypothetical protein